MQPRILVQQLLCATLLAVSLAGCTVSAVTLRNAVSTASAAKALAAESITPQPPQPLLATTTAASAPKTVIKSKGVELFIKDVSVSNGYPLGCDPKALMYAKGSCYATAPVGYAILLVTLRPPRHLEVSWEEWTPIQKQAYVVSDGNTKYKSELWAWEISPDSKEDVDLSVGFAVPTPMHTATLFWPDNPGIDLHDMIDPED